MTAPGPECVKTASKTDGVCFRRGVENSLEILGMVREGFLLLGQKMISHVFIGVNDFNRALVFYQGVMHVLGLDLKFTDLERPWAGWKHPDTARPLFVVGKPFDGESAALGNGQMIALLAPNRQIVDNAHALALALDGTCEGAPGLRPEYHPNFYGAYFRDPEGNKLCVCCHDPE